MRWRPGKKPGPLRYAGDPGTRGGFHSALIEHIDWMGAMHFSAHSIRHRRFEVGYFIDWCEERSMRRPDEVTRAVLERYRQYLFHLRGTHTGVPLSLQTQHRRLAAVKAFFKWLTRHDHLLFNPASELELPRTPQQLPRHLLSVAEIEQIINATDTDDPTGLGVRNRAMLETLYSTGMRRGELVAVRLHDVDLTRGIAVVRQGKGKKDRVVPIGGRACAWIEKYMYTIRPQYLMGEDRGVLFLAKYGEAMDGKQLSMIVKRAIEEANLERFRDTHPNAACHLFRHACATHMLENGADIRYIQALLGHAELTTTEIYTRVSILKLKEIHERTHPARLTRTTTAPSTVA